MTGPRRTLLLAAAFLALGAGPVRAQVQDPRPERPEQGRDRPERDTTAAAQDTLVPEPEYVPPRFAFTLSVGGLGLGTLQSQPVLVERRTLSGEVLSSADLSRSLEVDGGVRFHAAALASLNESWAVRVGFGTGRGTLRPEYAGGENQSLFVTAANLLARNEIADLTYTVVEAALRLLIPSFHWAKPYLELGGASLEWRADAPPASAAVLESGVRRVSVLAAVGAVIPWTDRLAGQVQVTRQVYRSPLEPVGAGEPGATSSTLAVTFREPISDTYLDTSRSLVSSLRLDVGLRFEVGRVSVDSEEPPEAPVPTLPPGR